MATIRIAGASDDLITIGGDIREEFYLKDDENGDLLAFSNRTILRVTYTSSGVWRIVPVVKGEGSLVIDQAPEDDEDNYSDKATLRTDYADVWVVHGIGMAKT